MGIRSMLKTWSYRKRVSGWEMRPGCALEVELAPPAVNGLLLGSHMESARCFGSPDGVELVDFASDYVRLEFRQHGLVLEYEHDQLIYIGILVSPLDDVPPRPDVTPACASIRGQGDLALSCETTAEDIVRAIGNPVDADLDAGECVLNHEIGGTTVETEYTHEGRLKRLNLFPTPT